MEYDIVPIPQVYARIFQDQLIAQSLICLRTCAEFLRVKASGLLNPLWHNACESRNCKIECIDNLNMHLSIFSQELSRVFFKKDNLRSKRPWWLSAFYSFCIQSVVRRALLKLTQDTDIDNNDIRAQDKRQYELVTHVGKQIQSAYVVFAINIREELILQNLSFTEEVKTIARSWHSLPSLEKETYLREALAGDENTDWEVAPIYGKTENPSLLLLFEPKLERRTLNFNLNAELAVRRNEKSAVEQYLYLPLRLFVAISAKLDPIATTVSWTSTAIDMDADMEAQLAVGQPAWLTAGINTSADYLKGLFQDSGNHLTEVCMENNMDRSCNVCKAYVPYGHEVVVLPCGHWFHEACAVAWLREINTCPTCREVIYEEPVSRPEVPVDIPGLEERVVRPFRLPG
ncbi:hypothetical protein EG329_002918 [Mollisiaceae sp. DMI_Dod_QoI]|nr:hypothetical protein EG329_002918 [Helotiales sp. DMI_Dod_QoI]